MSNMTKKHTHEPFFHVTKKDELPTAKKLLYRAGAVLIALLITGILSVILIKENPFKIYGALLAGPFVDIWGLLKETSVLLLFGLAVIPPFKMKFWNMGANGQVLVGCLAGIACMKFLTGKLPSVVIMLLIILASVAASVLWAAIPAIFKAFFNTNETLFTLMMNYIAITLIDYFVFLWDKSGSGTLGIVNLTGQNKKVGWFPVLGQKYMLLILTALIVTVLVYLYCRYTKHGFEVELVGESVSTAKYAGINVRKVIIRTLVLSGVICGILGALYAGSIEHTVNSSVGGKGFTAILVAWLAGFNPLSMLFTSFFVVFLDLGTKNISTVFNLNSNDYASIVVGIVFFCIIGCEFFIRYHVMLNSYWKQKLLSRFGKKKNEQEDA